MGISGTLGVAFAGIGYGLSKGFAALKVKFFNKPASGDMNFMKSNDKFYQNVSNRTDIDPNGALDVIAHGNSNMIEMNINGNRILADSRTAANIIQHSAEYNGQNIRLLSCSTGSTENGFAQNLANKLNVKVTAPNDLLWARPDGSTFIAPKLPNGMPDLSNLGRLVDFFPGGIIK